LESRFYANAARGVAGFATAERARRIFPLKIVDIGPPYRASSRHR
jgi:hypothetical protein